MITDGGLQHSGIVRNEDDKQLQLMTAEGKLVTVPKDTIEERIDKVLQEKRALFAAILVGGVIGGVMLGLGRALGETMAVTLILSPGIFTWNIIGSGNNTIPAEIALNFPEASGLRLSELIAAGLVLVVITLAVNLFARWIVDRRAEFSGAN